MAHSKAFWLYQATGASQGCCHMVTAASRSQVSYWGLPKVPWNFRCSQIFWVSLGLLGQGHKAQGAGQLTPQPSPASEHLLALDLTQNDKLPSLLGKWPGTTWSNVACVASQTQRDPTYFMLLCGDQCKTQQFTSHFWREACLNYCTPQNITHVTEPCAFVDFVSHLVTWVWLTKVSKILATSCSPVSVSITS